MIARPSDAAMAAFWTKVGTSEHASEASVRSAHSINWSRKGIDDTDCAAMLSENALALYDFDRAALRTLADEIGPLAGSFAEPPSARPADYVGMGLR